MRVYLVGKESGPGVLVDGIFGISPAITAHQCDYLRVIFTKLTVELFLVNLSRI